MHDFTSLLTQSPTSHTDRTEILNETLEQACRRSGEEMTDEHLALIVEGFRIQRTRWNAEQQQGTRKRVSSKKVEIPAGLQIKISKPII